MSKNFSFPKKQEYVGLSNQGATCYMNSLLQTLYMTPEFRREIFNWKYDEKFGIQDTCIPLQLQILFVRLQTCQSYSIETTALTKSFGWTQAESFQQHDVQEFCRVLFEAIEKSAKEVGSCKFIQDLYEGTYEDYVKCSVCFNGSVREDKFLDLSLTIKNQFEKIYNDSVEKALAGFVRPEYLTSGNQYYCDTCKSKQDAQKGLKFKKLPYILVIQLKRYDYDYNTNKRIKINDKVSFEEIMNLNYLLNDSVSEVSKMEVDEKDLESPNFFDVGIAVDGRYREGVKREFLMKNAEKTNLPMDVIAKRKYKEKKFFMKQEQRTQKIEDFLKQGPYVYELYSIMIHSGSAWGGHYYAYIKSFEKNKWYSFNDSNVVEISYKDVNKVFGGPSNFGSSTSAYLLMYRQINRERNLITVPDSEISSETQEILEKIQKKHEEETQKRLDDLKKITVSIKYKSELKEVLIKKDETIQNLKQAALARFNLNIDLCNSRLRELEVMNRPGKVFPDQVQLDKLSISYNKKILLETKEPEEIFEDYDPSKITIKYIEWIDNSFTLEEYESKAKSIKVMISSSSKMVLESISQVLNLPPTDLVVFRKHPYNMTLEKITSNEVKVSYSYNITVQENTFFFVEKNFKLLGKTCWEQYFDHESQKLTIRVNLNGDCSQDKKILIHPLKSLNELVLAISCKFNIPAETIILKKSHSVEEYKDLTQTIKSINPCNEIQVFRGTPLRSDQIRISVFFAEANMKPFKDQEFFKLFHLFDLPVELEISFREVKERILNEVLLAYPSMGLTIVRIREIRASGITRWLDDSMKIKDFTKEDGKKIAVQVIHNEDQIKNKDDIILSFKKLNTANWELEDQKDVIICSRSSYHTLGEKLSVIYSIPVNYM